MMINKRLAVKDGIFYIIAQALGSIVASAILYSYVHALKLPSDGFGQTDFPNISAAQALGNIDHLLIRVCYFDGNE